MSKPILSIIIPTKDRVKQLTECLNSLINATIDIPVEIIVINDSKVDFNIKFENIIILKNTKNGAASARNLGAEKASADLLLFLDDDMIIFKKNISTILTFHNQYSNAVLNLNWTYSPELILKAKKTVFGRYLIQYGFSTLKGWNRDNYWNDFSLFETYGITSQNLSLSKKLFSTIGGYDEFFPYAGFEDHIISKKLKENGIKIYLDPTSTMFHNENDRLNIEAWLNRKERGSMTRKIAVKKGHLEVELKYGLIKSIVINIFIPFKRILIALISKVNKIKNFDFIWFKILNVLLVITIYQGYNSKNIKSD